MLIACPDHAGGLDPGLLFLAAVILGGGTVFVLNRFSARARKADLRRLFVRLDDLDGREAEEAEYAEPMAALAQASLPEWAVLELIERVGDRESPSRRRYLEAMRALRIPAAGRERLLEIARDSSDPMAADAWSLLSGRPASGWAKALLDSDGGADERRFMA